MAILDDISKMIQGSDEFSKTEKDDLIKMCKEASDMETEAAE